MNGFSEKTWPLEIRVKSKEKMLEVDFDDGASFAIAALISACSAVGSLEDINTLGLRSIYGRSFYGDFFTPRFRLVSKIVDVFVLPESIAVPLSKLGLN